MYVDFFEIVSTATLKHLKQILHPQTTMQAVIIVTKYPTIGVVTNALTRMPIALQFVLCALILGLLELRFAIQCFNHLSLPRGTQPRLQQRSTLIMAAITGTTITAIITIEEEAAVAAEMTDTAVWSG